MILTEKKITNFSDQVKQLKKDKITVLQINLGRKCNLSCSHCHVEASPIRTEDLSDQVVSQLLTIINKFPQIQTVDLTGGAPEMHNGFREIVTLANKENKEVIVRSNLTIFYVNGYEYLPQFFAKNKVKVVASLPCYLEDNVDKQRGKGVYNDSISALQTLNKLGYGKQKDLTIDLVYNPPLPQDKNFRLTPNQQQLEKDYKKYLLNNFGIEFNQLLTITNLPIGRTKFYLDKHNLTDSYLEFLEDKFNSATLPYLMCKNQLSVDYLGNIYDCDFNQVTGINSLNKKGQKITLNKILQANNLDIINTIETANHCYGCTAGSGSSCGGAII